MRAEPFPEENRLFPVGSITRAFQGRDLLAAHHIRAEIRRLSHTAGQGCSYGLLVHGNATAAKQHLVQARLLRAQTPPEGDEL